MKNSGHRIIPIFDNTLVTKAINLFSRLEILDFK